MPTICDEQADTDNVRNLIVKPSFPPMFQHNIYSVATRYYNK